MANEKLQIRGLNHDQLGRVYSIDRPLTIGRSPNCNVFIMDLQASRRHTRFFRDAAGTLIVEDLRSSNGTYLNGNRLKSPQVLKVGDVIRLGSTDFIVEKVKNISATIISGQGYGETRLIKSAADILTGMDRPKTGLTTVDLSKQSAQDTLDKKMRQFTALFEMSKLIQGFADPDEMLEACLGHLLKVPGGSTAYMLMVEGDGLALRSAKSRTGEVSNDFRISKTLSHHVIDERCAVIAPDLLNDQRFSSSNSIIMGLSRSILAVPIIEGNIAKGMIALCGDDTLDESGEDDLELLCICASLIGPALRNLDLAKEIEETQREVVFTMGAIGETRSKETGNHVKRVAEYSRLLALLYGLDEPQAELLKQASPMHDIGKVGIPDRILNKPGRLNAEEWAIMKTHARLGYDMLNHSNRPILKAAAIVAHEHHEKWSGAGYPRGLKGEEIHIFGRITAVA
ncbi:MAG: HD domain-containing phosphohydrolase, partial [Myxococcota bacterium]|nr:HD domain-containing phosphohydrolase [Myxococcota bacterium]